MNEQVDSSTEKETLENGLIEDRKKKTLGFIKKNTAIIYALLLGIIIWISSHLRTRNLYGLKDITTGGYTLGPDLDPFLFLRWAKEIVTKGFLPLIDSMRYVPLGYNTGEELTLLPHSIAWFHKIAGIFGGDGSVEFSAIILPVFAFALTLIAFFFLVKETFKDSFSNKNIPSIIAILSALFLTFMPSLLARTIAGIPEKESIGFLFMFLAFYFFIVAWKAKSIKSGSILGVVAGIATALMVHAWGGSIYVYISIGLAVFVAFIFNKTNKTNSLVYGIWLISSIVLTVAFTQRYSLQEFIMSTSTGLCFMVLFFIIVDFILFSKKLESSFLNKIEKKVSRKIFSIFVAVVLVFILSMIFFGGSFIQHLFSDAISKLKTPYTDRLSFTVAENRQPFFTDEWMGSFGPSFRGIPIFFWLFLIGSMYLFYNLAKFLGKKERIIWVASYSFMLIAMIFSKYSPSSQFNGASPISGFLYLAGFIAFIAATTYIYYRRHKKNDFEVFKKLDFSILLLICFFLISLIGGRSAVRLIMVIGPPASIIASYFVIALVAKAININKRKIDSSSESGKGIAVIIYFVALVTIICSIYTLYVYANSTYSQASGFTPNVYTQQWQEAMKWVRDNTDKNAVFAHWWDYGYWLQSIGERATIVDGGNAIPYWNHLVGRHALTGPSEEKALELLYTHNVTHFLIDSTDIGKYSAFSNIGSDENYDRYSWIPAMLQDSRSTQETSNGTSYLYQGGFGIDSDISYDINGEKVYLPSGKAGLGAVVLKVSGKLSDLNSSEYDLELSQPYGIYVYQNKQYNIPLKYAYFKGKLYKYQTGLEAGIFIMPSLSSTPEGGVGVNSLGAILYLSDRTVNSQLARIYLFDEKQSGFKLVHTESNFIVKSLETQNPDIVESLGEFVYYNGVQGPIKIWEVKYPSNIKANPDYLKKEYPNKELYVVK